MTRRVTIVSSELLGRPGTGGAGTADSLLAVALGRHGHDVRLLVASGREIGQLNPKWTTIYADAGVDVHVLDPLQGVRPSYLRPPLEVYRALRDSPPEVAIVNEWRGLGFAALRARQTGLALEHTAFVAHCHSPGRVLTAFAQKVPDTLERFGEDVAERASIELADAVVCPSAWLLEWMRAHRWPVPHDARVIQYVRQSAALAEPPPAAPPRERVRRLAFFGQLREGKGIRIFVAALQRIDARLLEGAEVLFLGAARAPWTRERIVAELGPSVNVRVESALERDAALDELRTPGTLAVVPSLLDNSPNTVSECIEHGVPFVATRTGGIPELVAEADRSRVLCAPTADDLAEALARALASVDGFTPARAAQTPDESLTAWLEVVDSVEPGQRPVTPNPRRVSVVADGGRSARRLADRTREVEVEVVEAASRRDGLRRASADWIVFLDPDDAPDDSMLDTLFAAQTASGADVVTAAVRRSGGIELFLGEPGALGLVENRYGVVGLVRRTPQLEQHIVDGGADPDWPLFARLALDGARIVSIPEALSTHTGRIGSVADVPGEGVTVLEAFEACGGMPDLPQLAATLAAAVLRHHSAPHSNSTPTLVGRVLRRVGALRG
jgi:glycosyltransferase involved in cell wall biosynthesis